LGTQKIIKRVPTDLIFKAIIRRL